MARRHYSKATLDSLEYTDTVYTVRKGGTQARANAYALNSLGIVNPASGSSRLVTLEPDGTLPRTKLPLGITKNSHVVPISNIETQEILALPHIRLGVTVFFKITDYDFEETYELEAYGGAVASRTDDIITYTAPSEWPDPEEGCGFILNNKRYPTSFSLTNADIETPKIITPTNYSDNVSTIYTFTASPFYSNNPNVEHAFSSWEISLEPDFTGPSLTATNSLFYMTSWTVALGDIFGTRPPHTPPLTDFPSTQFYIRVRYHANIDGGESTDTYWSNTVTFNTREENVYRQTQALSPMDPSEYTLYGNSVAVSDDGAVVAIGAPATDGEFGSQVGAVYVYRKIDTHWLLEDTLADPSVTDIYSSLFGTSIAMSGDGNNIVVGIPNYDGGKGCGLLFTHSVAGWTASSRFYPASLPALAHLGSRVVMNQAGTVVALGSKDCTVSDLASAGRVYVYRKTNNTWSLNGTLQATTPSENDYFGTTLAINAAGDRLAITALNVYNEASGVYIADYAANTWSLTDAIHISPSQYHPLFGRALTFDDSGDFLYISINTHTPNAGDGTLYSYQKIGSVWVFKDSWSSTSRIPEGTYTDGLGSSLCTNSDGTKVLSTASDIVRNGNYMGAGYLFIMDGEGARKDINSEKPILKRDIPIRSGLGGFAASAMSRDGFTIVIGAPGDYYNGMPYSGMAYIFQQ